jgi:predicted nucleic acid-binding protein
MSDRVFIDTNIFAYIQRKDDPVKSQIAQKAVSFFDCVISTQVVNEFCSLFMQDGLLVNNSLTIVNIFNHTDLLK